MTAKTALRVFRRRINIERKVLKTVNEALTSCHPLTGLTERAIFRWANDLNEHYDSKKFRHLVKVIKEISIRSMLNTDCSRDVFSNDEPKKATPIQNLYNHLEETLKEVVHR